MKGVRKAPTVVTSKAARRLGAFSTLAPGSRVCINPIILPLTVFGVKAKFAEPEIGRHYIRSLRAKRGNLCMAMTSASADIATLLFRGMAPRDDR
jgi:hypothetical protein